MIDEEEIIKEELSSLEKFIAEKKEIMKRWQERRKRLKENLRRIKKKKERDDETVDEKVLL